MNPRIWSTKLLIAGLSLLALAACGAGGGGGGGGGGGSVTTPVGDKPTIVAAVPFSVSESCPNGGVHVDWGIDANGNGVLDPAEIAGGGDICNGGNGQPMVIQTSTFTSGHGCAAGGVLIEMGLDVAPYNGALDTGEKTGEAAVCYGADGISALIVTSIEPPGDNCPYGGLKIETSSGGSGVVTNYVCNVGSMPLIQVLGSDVDFWAYSDLPLGISNWDRIDGLDVEEQWTTVGDGPIYLYSPYILVNNSGETRSLDLIGQWTGAEYGNLTAYPYPFNPLSPLQPQPTAWSTDHWVFDGEGWLFTEAANILRVTLAPHAAAVVVASADNPYTRDTVDLSLVPYTWLDASEGSATALGQSVAQGGSRHYKATGFAGQANPNLPTLAPVRISLSGMDDNADLGVYLEPFTVFNAEALAVCSTTGTNPTCDADLADAEGNLWIEVYGSGESQSIGYDLTVATPTNQGTSGNPVALTLWADPLPSSVGLGTSYYAVSGVVADTYIVTVSGLTPQVTVNLYVTETGMSGAAATCQDVGQVGNASCMLEMTDGTGIGITVDGSPTEAGVFFEIQAYPMP